MTTTNPEHPNATALGCEALRDDLLALLYDEGTPSEKARAKEHVGDCPVCREEFAAFANVRTQIGTWTVPAEARGNLARGRFDSPRTSSPSWRPAAVLGWSLAAAAGIAVGVGIATTGRGLVAPPTASAIATAAPSAEGAISVAQVRELLDEQDRRHQAELEGIRNRVEATLVSLQSQPQRAPAVSIATPASFQRILRESEDRHTRLVEARIAQLRRENELQRQYDLAQVAASLAFLDNRAGAEAARTSELMKNLVRVTTRPQDR